MALIFILITSITIYSFLQSDEDEKLASEVVESYQETIALPGIYTVKLKNNAIDMSGSFMTAALKYDSINHNYMLLVTSEYQPEMHFFNRLSNDSIYSPTLGGGRVYYKEKLDKTTLIFKNNHLEWIFVK